MDTFESPTSQASILDLNDDCLRHVFEHLKRDDLVAAADVCIRFRENAQAEFAHSKKEKKLEIGGLTSNSLFKASKIMRVFGSFIKVVWLEGTFDYDTDQCYSEKSLRLLNRYHYATLTELQLIAVDLTDNIQHLLRPLLRHLHVLTMTCCRVSNVFLNELSKTTPDLQRLRLQCSYLYRSESRKSKRYAAPALRSRTQSKVQEIQFFSCDVDNETIDESFAMNPKLKNIIVEDCSNAGDQIFASIAMHVPHVETVTYKPRKINNRFITPDPIKLTNIVYLGRLKNLKSLALILQPDSTPYMLSAMRKLVAANIPLEHLHLQDFDLRKRTDQFINEISKLKGLKTLKLKGLAGLMPSDILDICLHLSELEELYFLRHCSSHMFTSNHILQLLQNANKLQLFCCHDQWLCDHLCNMKAYCIDADIFGLMVNSIERRPENKQLKICLDNNGYTVSVPDALAVVHKRTLTIALNELNDKCY